MKKKASKITDKQLQYLQRIELYSEVGSVAKKFIGIIPYLAFYYFFSDAIKEYAGKVSYADVNIVFNLIAKTKASVWIPYSVGIIGFGYGIGERKYRKKKIKYFSTRVSKLEKIIDPDRSGSKLNQFGETNEKD